MIKSALHQTLDTWLSALCLYNEDLIVKKPGPGEWSLGELYIHLIEETNYYFGEVGVCIRSNENAAEEFTADAETIFANNALPDIRIKGNAELSRDLSLPIPVEDIRHEMQQLKDQLSALCIGIDTSTYAGKTRHPGQGYFNAAQWLQFADIHMRQSFKTKSQN